MTPKALLIALTLSLVLCLVLSLGLIVLDGIIQAIKFLSWYIQSGA